MRLLDGAAALCIFIGLLSPALSWCVPPDGRCADALGKLFDSSKACCDPDALCKEEPTLGRGSFCIRSSSVAARRFSFRDACTATNERCAGAPGMPLVPWLGCCDPAAECIEDAEMGWGRFCIVAAGNVHISLSVDPHACTATNQRCAGAPGRPFVPWQGCCDTKAVCAEDSSKGWGRFCILSARSAPNCAPARKTFKYPAPSPYEGNWSSTSNTGSASGPNVSDSAAQTPVPSQPNQAMATASVTPFHPEPVPSAIQTFQPQATSSTLQVSNPTPSVTPSPTPRKIPDEPYLATLATERRRNERISLPGGSRSPEYYWFDNFAALNRTRWFFAGPWWNGPPFANAFLPNLYSISNRTLALYANANSGTFTDSSGLRLNYTSGEIRTWSYYGYGCYSVCMKPAPVSGVSSSFYAYAGKYDDPDNRGPLGNPPGQGKFHNEIDVEFLGYDTTILQTNYFSLNTTNITSPASGNERLHHLGYDAAEDFHVYGFRWTGDDQSGTGGGVEWFVDGQSIRKVTNQTAIIPDANYSYLRVMANLWVVDNTASGWAGIPPAPQRFPENAAAEYKWIMFTEAQTDDTLGRSTCVMPTSCS